MPQPIPTLDELNARGEGFLPGLIGVKFTHAQVTPAGGALIRSELTIRPELLAPNGFLHAAVIVSIADTSAGYGTRLLLPEGANFTTIELKTNHLGTARAGTLTCEARSVHAGRTTQVWDAEVKNPEGKVMALFRCTQAVLYPGGERNQGRE